VPGIFGLAIIDDREKIDPEQADSILARMEAVLTHRTEDVIDSWSNTDSGLHVRRIGAPHVNRTPFVGESELDGIHTVALVAGVLHGSHNSDSASRLASSFEQSGLAALQRAGGFFSTLIFSSSPATMTIATDRRASIPLYYAEVGNILYFAPEPKALMTVPGLARELDLEALAIYLGSGHTLGHQSLLKAIRRLGGGQALVLKRGRLERIPYWQFSPGACQETASATELKDELGRLVEAAAQRNMGRPDRTVIFLSGGADCRGILGGVLASRQVSGSEICTASWGADPGAGESDVRVAERIATEFNLNHRFLRRKLDKYGEHFAALNYLIDGQTDIAAMHPYEFRLMLELREAGFERALRGDETFGWHYRVYSHSDALAKVGLRRISDLALAKIYLQPAAHETLVASSESAIDSVTDSVRDMEPNDAKDCLYFNHRLQGYLNSADYYKKVVLDTRNPLLDESVLDFIERVPSAFRIDKTLFRQAMQNRYSKLWSIPMSKTSNLEDWTWQLGNETIVRDYVIEQLEDAASGVWQFFDRLALRQILESLAKHNSSRGGNVRRVGREYLRRAVFSLSPRIGSGLRAGRDARFHPPYLALLRILAFKEWYDTVVCERAPVTTMSQRADIPDE